MTRRLAKPAAPATERPRLEVDRPVTDANWNVGLRGSQEAHTDDQACDRQSVTARRLTRTQIVHQPIAQIDAHNIAPAGDMNQGARIGGQIKLPVFPP
jgi:hypothetical protein